MSVCIKVFSGAGLPRGSRDGSEFGGGAKLEKKKKEKAIYEFNPDLADLLCNKKKP